MIVLPILFDSKIRKVFTLVIKKKENYLWRQFIVSKMINASQGNQIEIKKS